MQYVTKPRCVVCGISCVPLADYDAPTCVGCDDVMSQILELARYAPSVPPTSGAPTWLDDLPAVDGCGTPRGVLAHIHKAEPVCGQCAHVYEIAVANVAGWRVARGDGDERTAA